MDVLVTGAYGRCGTAILDHLGGRDEYAFTCLDVDDQPDVYATHDHVACDVTDLDALRAATAGHDAVVHLAADPRTDAPWDRVLRLNVIGTYNVLEAARDAGVESFVFASTNHVMGRYEDEHSPDLYDPGYGLVLDRTDPVRPDSHYGASKSFGEDLLRTYVEDRAHPGRGYALRICNVSSLDGDDPYAGAEAAVAAGDVERGDDEYERRVARAKAMWHSRRDFAHEVDCCLRDDDVAFGVYAGVSDNQTRWFSIERARVELGYEPRDDGAERDGPA